MRRRFAGPRRRSEDRSRLQDDRQLTRPQLRFARIAVASLALAFAGACGARTALREGDDLASAFDGGSRDALVDVRGSDGAVVRPPDAGVSCADGGKGTHCPGPNGPPICVDLTNDPNHCGKCSTRCRRNEACSQGRCEAVASSLTGLRWELPCLNPSGNTSCATPGVQRTTATLGGVPGTQYDVELRFRGVVETEGYTGGENDGAFFQIGGAPIMDTWNIYELDVSSPPQKFYLNRGQGGLYYCFAIDYTKTIPMNAGATVTLIADPVDSAREEIVNVDQNGRAIVVPGVPPAPNAFDGQFIQMDVVAIR